MGKPSDHIVPGSLCVACNKAPAIVLTRLVARDDGMAADGILWAAATCWDCARQLASARNASTPVSPNTSEADDIARSLLGLDGFEVPKVLRLRPLAIQDDRTFEEKLRAGDVSLEPDEQYCDVCTWPKRLCVCAGTKRGRKS
ncbi:MAG: hypothetical protein WC565_07735 [Parcubacteria group bacterium]